MIQSVWKNLTGLQKAAEHLWCDFKWATNSSPNTNDLYIHYMDKSIGTPSLEEKKALTNCANKDIHVLKNCISISVTPVLKCMRWRHPYVQVISVWWWVFHVCNILHLVMGCFCHRIKKIIATLYRRKKSEQKRTKKVIRIKMNK